MHRIFLSLAFLACTAAAQTSLDGTTNSFIAAVESVGGRTIQVNLNITYPATAIAEDYLDVAALRQDTSAVVAGVSNKSAPLELFAASIAQGILDKYPQLQSVGVQVLYGPSQGAQQTVQSIRTRPAKVATPAVSASK